MLKLDSCDIRILSVLSKEGRLSNSELAKRIELSPSACRDRVKRLEKAGVLSGYSARLCLNDLVESVTFFVMVNLEDQQSATEKTFEHYCLGARLVIRCWSLGGNVDYMLQVITPDIDTYQALMDEMLDAELKIVSYFSYLVHAEVKVAESSQDTSLLLEWLAER